MDTKKKSGLAILIGMGKPKDKAAEGGDEQVDSMPPAIQSTESEQSEQQGQYITPPKGFQPPDDKQTGQSFSGTFRAHMDDDGNLCFDAINDIPMHDEGAETEEQEAEETQEEQAKEEELGLEEHEAPEPTDDESSSRRKFDKVFGRRK